MLKYTNTSPIFITEEGIVICVTVEHFENKRSEIYTISPLISKVLIP